MSSVELKPAAVILPAAGRWSLWGMGVFVAVAMVVHAIVGVNLDSPSADVDVVLSGRPNSFVFAGVGGLFVFSTLLSHFTITRSAHPLSILIVPMTIRFCSTFLILAGLLSLTSISRGEALFDILFWYVSLTTIEVAGIVWASKSASKTIPSNIDSATKGA